jgi:hypothetical protein
VKLPANFASMSVDELWEIHEEISKLLEAKMHAEKEKLELRLISVHAAQVAGDPVASAAGQRRGAPAGGRQPEGAAAGRKADAMKAGDRVKLTDAAASRLMNAYYRRCVVDWRKRRGTLHHVRLNKVEAVVFWDGRSSMEVVPIKYLELEKIGEPPLYGGTDYIIAPDKAPTPLPTGGGYGGVGSRQSEGGWKWSEGSWKDSW